MMMFIIHVFQLSWALLHFNYLICPISHDDVHFIPAVLGTATLDYLICPISYDDVYYITAVLGTATL